MPMILNVGLSKKIGQPNYGSLGASCNVQVELPANLIAGDLESCHRQARKAYVACSQAVNDELAWHQGQSNGRSTKAYRPVVSVPATSAAGPQNGNGHAADIDHGAGGGVPGASQRQIDYINQLARQVRGLDVRRLEELSQRMCGMPVAGLSSLDASGLIDCLKAINAGKINLDNALNGATS
jgi:hypothetical protein